MFSVTNLSGCYPYPSDPPTVFFWTAGQRIHPDRNTTFIWRMISTEPRSETVSAMTYTNWAHGQPDFYQENESCVLFHRGTIGTWNDRPCTNECCFVCEVDI